MTIGQKIRHYREKLGISQEELGQKIFISQETVNLWETDETLPTIDNLRRLMDIFSISIDELLSDAEPTEENVKEPKESYTLKYTREELQDFFRKKFSPQIKRAIVSLLVLLACSIFFLASTYYLMSLFLFICFLVNIARNIKGYLTLKKEWQTTEGRMMQSTYLFEVFDGYFVLTVAKGEEIIKTLKVYFEDVEKVENFGNYLVLHIPGQLFLIKRDSLNFGSAFTDLHDNASKIKEDKTKITKKSFKVLSLSLFILSICTVWLALACVSLLCGINHYPMDENMWVFFLFLPFPIASIVFGFYLKKKGCKYKKNVIAGFIMAALLCIYGSFTFLSTNTYSHTDEPILAIEQELNIDIPEHSHINTQTFANGGLSFSYERTHSTSDVFFEDAAVEKFEQKLLSDTRWINKITNDMIGITSYFCDIEDGNYYIIYNKDTNELNKLPSESGKYLFVNIIYDVDNNTMKLVEYEIEYIKNISADF